LKNYRQEIISTQAQKPIVKQTGTFFVRLFFSRCYSGNRNINATMKKKHFREAKNSITKENFNSIDYSSSKEIKRYIFG